MDLFPVIICGVVGGVVGGLLAGLGVLVYGLLKAPKKCPQCGAPFPKFRKPANRRQLLWGGWTCSNCGSEMDRHGRKVEDADT